MAATNNTPIGSRPRDVLDSSALDIQYDQDIQSDDPSNIIKVAIGSEIGASISIAGEEDLFRFEVPAFGSYTIGHL